jgi:hypothetical protein
MFICILECCTLLPGSFSVTLLSATDDLCKDLEYGNFYSLHIHYSHAGMNRSKKLRGGRNAVGTKGPYLSADVFLGKQHEPFPHPHGKLEPRRLDLQIERMKVVD